jgi:hypothetical protein
MSSSLPFRPRARRAKDTLKSVRLLHASTLTDARCQADALAQAFESCDCDASTPLVLAAYVVLKGRHRVAAPLAP